MMTAEMISTITLFYQPLLSLAQELHLCLYRSYRTAVAISDDAVAKLSLCTTSYCVLKFCGRHIIISEQTTKSNEFGSISYKCTTQRSCLNPRVKISRNNSHDNTNNVSYMSQTFMIYHTIKISINIPITPDSTNRPHDRLSGTAELRSQ